ncbi:hypothetical protein Pelo_4104 [Pelomyxa schiedti]|nr:hypothetical protein Pelo_4104 [Pelomyxa schiedti]
MWGNGFTPKSRETMRTQAQHLEQELLTHMHSKYDKLSVILMKDSCKLTPKTYSINILDCTKAIITKWQWKVIAVTDGASNMESSVRQLNHLWPFLAKINALVKVEPYHQRKPNHRIRWLGTYLMLSSMSKLRIPITSALADPNKWNYLEALTLLLQGPYEGKTAADLWNAKTTSFKPQTLCTENMSELQELLHYSA